MHPFTRAGPLTLRADPGIVVNMLLPLMNLTTSNGTSLVPDPNDDELTVFEAGLGTGGGWLRVAFKIGGALIMCVPNFFLVGNIDKLLMCAGILALVPFIVFTGACIPYFNSSNLAEYNLSSFDNFGGMLEARDDDAHTHKHCARACTCCTGFSKRAEDWHYCAGERAVDLWRGCVCVCVCACVRVCVCFLSGSLLAVGPGRQAGHRFVMCGC